MFRFCLGHWRSSRLWHELWSLLPDRILFFTVLRLTWWSRHWIGIFATSHPHQTLNLRLLTCLDNVFLPHHHHHRGVLHSDRSRHHPDPSSSFFCDVMPQTFLQQFWSGKVCLLEHIPLPFFVCSDRIVRNFEQEISADTVIRIDAERWGYFVVLPVHIGTRLRWQACHSWSSSRWWLLFQIPVTLLRSISPALHGRERHLGRSRLHCMSDRTCTSKVCGLAHTRRGGNLHRV